MKIHTEIIIDADQKDVWRAFDDRENLHKWQPSLKSFKHVSGEPGQPGAISESVYVEKGRDVRMTEYITERREPHFMAGRIESDWGQAILVNQFEDLGDGRTRWSAWWNYTFKGFHRLMAPFMKGSTIKQIDDLQQRFKLMVESESA